MLTIVEIISGINDIHLIFCLNNLISTNDPLLKKLKKVN